MKSSARLLVCGVVTVALMNVVAKADHHLKPVESIEKMATILGADRTVERLESVFDKSKLMFDVEGIGKEGDEAQLRVITTYGVGGKFVFDDATVVLKGKTAPAFHAVWGPDGTGGIRAWVFRADGVAYGGPVVTDGKRVIVKMKGAGKAETEAEKTQFGDSVVEWTGDLVFQQEEEEGTMSVQAKDIVVNGKIKLPDGAKEIGRRVE